MCCCSLAQLAGGGYSGEEQARDGARLEHAAAQRNQRDQHAGWLQQTRSSLTECASDQSHSKYVQRISNLQEVGRMIVV